MIKIDRKSKSETSYSLFTRDSGRATSQIIPLEKGSFAQEIKNNYRSQLEGEISDLIEKLEISGKRFSENPNVDNLTIYKKNVQSFLSFATKNSYQIKEVYGRRVDYKIVNTINSKLEELSQQVISQEVPRMSLLAKIDEIRGLIIDLIL
ncbi:MAG: YaaR family protein [Spirochaetota bacterium]|nr:YaaR family protein [Spirochaetota bacterium]